VLRPASSLVDYAAAPDGRALRGRGWASFCARLASPGLWGFSVWGRVEREDALALLAALRLELHTSIPPHRSIIDASRLLDVPKGSFDAFADYVREAHEALGSQVTALAIVRPPGLEGAVVAGFFQVLPPPYPVSVHDSVANALAAVAVDDDGVIAAAIAGLAIDDEEGDDDGAVLRARLEVLADDAADLNLADAAKRLGVSERTLQRRLKEAGTAFSEVLRERRLQRALVRITREETPLTVIALDEGFASVQHLGQAVKKATGRSPTALRGQSSSSSG